jgi:hypothetical protein
MLLAVLFQKEPKFRHFEFKPRDVPGHNPIAISVKHSFLEAEDCCVLLRALARTQLLVLCI